MKKILIVILVLLNYSDVMAKELRGWKALEIGMDFDKAHDIVKTICKTRDDYSDYSYRHCIINFFGASIKRVDLLHTNEFFNKKLKYINIDLNNLENLKKAETNLKNNFKIIKDFGCRNNFQFSSVYETSWKKRGQKEKPELCLKVFSNKNNDIIIKTKKKHSWFPKPYYSVDICNKDFQFCDTDN